MNSLSTSGLQPFLVLPAVNQIGIVVRDVLLAVDVYSKSFGVGPFRVFEPDYTQKMYRGGPEDFRVRLAIAAWGAVDVELIQTLSGRTIYDEFLGEHGEGLHHLGFVVPDLSKSVKSFAEIGATVLQSGRRTGVSWAYVDTVRMVGFIVELIELHSPSGH